MSHLLSYFKLLLLALFGFCVLYSLIHYTQDRTSTSKEVEVAGWGYTSPRDASLYLSLLGRGTPRNFCQTPTLLTVMVHSSPHNRRRRDLLRQLWHNCAVKSEIALFFLLGQTLNGSMEAVEEERDKYGDLIQDHFLDTYPNLTLKTLSMMKTYTQYCNSSFLLKVDDDTFINFNNIVQMLRNSSSDLLLGHLFCEARPERGSTARWYSPQYLYPFEVYPSYLSGGGYVMSSTVAQRLYQVVQHSQLFHLEDVFLTGICAVKAGVRPRHHPLFAKKLKVLNRNLCMVKELYAVFDTGVGEFVKLHRQMVGDGGCEEEPFWGVWWLFENYVKVKSPVSYRTCCI